MRPVQPVPGSEHKTADADLLGEAATVKPPGRQKVENSGKAQAPVAGPGASLLPEPPPAEDENQPGFIGERNRPAT